MVTSLFSSPGHFLPSCSYPAYLLKTFYNLSGSISQSACRVKAWLNKNTYIQNNQPFCVLIQFFSSFLFKSAVLWFWQPNIQMDNKIPSRNFPEVKPALSPYTGIKSTPIANQSKTHSGKTQFQPLAAPCWTAESFLPFQKIHPYVSFNWSASPWRSSQLHQQAGCHSRIKLDWSIRDPVLSIDANLSLFYTSHSNCMSKLRSNQMPQTSHRRHINARCLLDT